MKLSGSKLRPRWKYFVATVPAAHPNPDSTAHSLGPRSPVQFHGSTTSASPANANATANHCPPFTRSCSTGHAISSVQNGIVNTSTDVRPAPPPASAIDVAEKLIVVWKNPVTTIASHDGGISGRRCATSTAKRTSVASHVRSTLSITGCACWSANFITIQLLPQISVSTASAT